MNSCNIKLNTYQTKWLKSRSTPVINSNNTVESTDRVTNLLKKACTHNDCEAALRMVSQKIRNWLGDADYNPHERTSICFNHPDDDTKVILFTLSGTNGRYVIYRWGNETNNQLLPRMYDAFHGHDNDSGAYSFLIMEKLDHKNKLNHGKSNIEAKRSKNYFHTLILKVVESIVDNDQETYDKTFSTFITFIQKIRTRTYSYHCDYPEIYPHYLNIRTIRSLMPWLRDCYSLFKTLDKISRRRLHQSEIFARGRSLVMTNPCGTFHQSYIDNTISSSNYKLKAMFDAKVSDELTNCNPLVMVSYGITDVGYKCTPVTSVPHEVNIYSFYIQPITC